VDNTPPALAVHLWVRPEGDALVYQADTLAGATVTTANVFATPAASQSLANVTVATATEPSTAVGLPTPATTAAFAITCTELSGSACDVVVKLHYEEAKQVVTCDAAGGSGGSGATTFTDLPLGHPLLAHNGTRLVGLDDDVALFVAPRFVSHGGVAVPPGAALTGGAAQVSQLPDGRYELEVTATDVAHNARHATVAWFVDTARPGTPTLTHPLPDTLVSPSTSLFVRVDLVDTSPRLDLARVMYLFDADPGAEGVALPVEYVTVDADAGTLSADIFLGDSNAGSLTGNEKLSDGGHQLTVWVVDAAGNSGLEEDLQWQVQSAGPCTQVIDGPPPRSGRNIVTFKFRAVQAKAATGNCTTDDESLLDPVLGATFEVQIEPPNWVTVCAPNAPGTVTAPTAEDKFGYCTYQHPVQTVNTQYVMRIRALNGLNVASSEPQTHIWRYEECDRGEYAVLDDVTGAIDCKACPTGADCPGGIMPVDEVQPESGWWSGIADDSNGGGGGDKDVLRIYKCPLPEACVGRTVTNNGTVKPAGCAEGYFDVLCGRCAEGYFRQFGKWYVAGRHHGVWGLPFTPVCVCVAVCYLQRGVPSVS